MAKRRLIGETPLPGEKAKLHHQVDPDEQISNTRALDSLPLLLASPEPREIRKRTTDPQSDTLEAVEVKRARQNSSEPPDSDSKLWPGIGYDPSGEEPNWNYLLSEKAYDESYHEDNMPADEPNPLPSPEPSDRDAAEGDEREFPTASPEQAQHPIPILGQDSDSEKDSGSEQGSDSEQNSGPEQDSGPELWPGVGYPSEKEPNWIQQKYARPYQQHLLSEKAYDESYNEDNIRADEPNPLLNPEPSDRDAAETVSPDQARHSTIDPYRIFSPPPLRKRDRVPPRRKGREPLKEGKNKRKKSKLQDEALSPAVKAFLRSTRSSRRDSDCKLWCLGDDGMACTVLRVR
ncbi:hypothetical protein ACHAPV_007740 [Trichoderma viride]